MSDPSGGDKDRRDALSPLDTEALGELYDAARRAQDAGDLAAAAKLFAACLDLDPADHCGVALRLAQLGDEPPPSAPPAYVATLFNQQAEAFERILVDQLGYDVPALAKTLVAPHLASDLNVLDLGCGTGLAGAAFRDRAQRMVGVDLSEDMLALADARGAYDELYVGEAVAFLTGWDEAPFDLVVATDVLPYLGDLAPFAHAAAVRLAPGGLIVASTERAAEGWHVNTNQRFAHGRDYLSATLTDAGLTVREIAAIVVRHEEGEPVAGDLVLAQRAA